MHVRSLKLEAFKQEETSVRQSEDDISKNISIPITRKKLELNYYVCHNSDFSFFKVSLLLKWSWISINIYLTWDTGSANKLWTGKLWPFIHTWRVWPGIYWFFLGLVLNKIVPVHFSEKCSLNLIDLFPVHNLLPDCSLQIFYKVINRHCWDNSLNVKQESVSAQLHTFIYFALWRTCLCISGALCGELSGRKLFYLMHKRKNKSCAGS